MDLGPLDLVVREAVLAAELIKKLKFKAVIESAASATCLDLQGSQRTTAGCGQWGQLGSPANPGRLR